MESARQSLESLLLLLTNRKPITVGNWLKERGHDSMEQLYEQSIESLAD